MKAKIPKIPKAISVFTLAMINVAAVSSVKNWPFTAELGFSSMFYFILAALVFFFPVSLVSAELATGWPKRGGVYLWVKEAFGPKWGFLAVWLQWIENIVWYPTVLSFAAGTVAYLVNPNLANSTIYTIVMVLLIFWGATIANFFGMKTSGWFSDMGAICGTLIPGTIIILLGGYWLIEGAPLQIDFSMDAFLPDFNLSSMVLFTGVLLTFAGIEMSAVHALDVRNPQKDYPKAILFSAILILSLSILGVLAIAIVVPQKDISLTAGTMQAFTIFLSKYNLKALIPFVAVLMAAGLFGSVCTWIIGPTKGLLAAGQEGNLPPVFHKTNRHQAPVALMIAQGIIASALCLMFFLMPTISSGFWILTVLVAQLYLVMYILVLIAALRLRYSQPKHKRPYKIPGGNVGMWVVCGLGILSGLFALLIGYIPPDQFEIGNKTFYTGFLICGTVLGCIAPFIILLFKKPDWKAKQ
ncbi:MAG: Glutamate/gamma-aminobutyrate antiporter [Chlamydiae bacterium]|nr:Glutamate/gamma-aminobutyrate antiporter [Chlamydiota bacterium]